MIAALYAISYRCACYAQDTVPRFAIIKLGDFVEGEPRDLSISFGRTEKGWKLALTLDEFRRQYPNTLSPIEAPPHLDSPDAKRRPLEFACPEALPALFHIWKAPLKAYFTALIHGTDPYSQLNPYRKNPLLHMWDIEWRDLPNGSKIRKTTLDELPTAGCYLQVAPPFHYYMELTPEGWAMLEMQTSIYRLRQGKEYIVNTYPKESDWECIHECEYIDLNTGILPIYELPFGTYMFTSEGDISDKNHPPVFIQIISVTRESER